MLAVHSPPLQTAAKSRGTAAQKVCNSSMALLCIQSIFPEAGCTSLLIQCPVLCLAQLVHPCSCWQHYFLDLTSTPSRSSMFQEFLCLISRFQVLCTLLCSGAVDTSCSSWHVTCAWLVCLPAPFQLLLGVKDMWLGGRQLSR